MTEPHVRVRQDSFDFAHPCEKQVQVFARIPGLKPVSYLLPTGMWEQVRTAEWGNALDVAHEYYAANVWGDTAREAKDALRTWLASTENRLLLTNAWTADLIKRDPAVRSMVTQLTDERDRARRIAVALEQENAELTRQRDRIANDVVAALPSRADVLREAAALVARFTGNDLDANAKMLRRAAEQAAK
ncbi:hypothetical protein Salbus254_5879 [Streptomyces albidoflavus]|uniref:hypothetical protein n=1 Tax=Streptomyces albidoflavus TaxID=1886 RepID=UPI0007758BEE|nr:hypothetical protein [Streptomyces albidoflavus]AMM12307.1 hypothetical protein Salbus254_5879 [Streptomyces albidoflavus]